MHLGDIIVECEDIYGDGVNVAARLEGLAEPGGICLSQQAYDQVETKLDLAVVDIGPQQVKNIARPIRVFRILDGQSPGAKPKAPRRFLPWPAIAALVLLSLLGAATAVLWWPESEQPAVERASVHPAIAVLPFDNLSGDPGQDYFSDGITEDLITDLSRISGLFVVAQHTMLTYKGRAVNVRKVGEELGVQYVLEGSVRKAGNRVRVNAQLVDAANGHHLWAERFDRELTDVFALQDEVAQKIVSALAITLTPDEQERLSQAALANPDAYDLLLRGLERYRRFTRETNAEAREYFERAVAIDPDFVRAHADIALTHAEELFHGWTDTPERSSRLALEMAQQALKLDNNSRVGHFAVAYTHLSMKRYDEALVENRRVLDLDSNHADGHAQRAMIMNYVGRSAEGLEAIRIAMRLNPRYPFFYVWILGQAHFS